MTYEIRRLDALRALNLLDTPASESFDRITRMAAQLFNLPIAAVSLTDTDRQWFKSRVGVDHWQIPRELAPCGEVSDSCGAVIVEDLLADGKYKNSVLAKSGVRFYAGAPLTTRDGYTLGAMYVLGTEPRDVSEQEKVALQDLAAMVMAQIELQHAFGRIDPSTGLPNRNQMEDDITDAARDYPGEERVAVLVDLLPVQQLSDALRVVGPAFVDEIGRNAAQKLRDALPQCKLYQVDSTHFGLVLAAAEPTELYRFAQTVRSSLLDTKGDKGGCLALRPVVGMAPFKLGSLVAGDVLRVVRSATRMRAITINLLRFIRMARTRTTSAAFSSWATCRRLLQRAISCGWCFSLELICHLVAASAPRRSSAGSILRSAQSHLPSLFPSSSKQALPAR